MENKVTKSKSSIVSLVTVTAILAIIFLFGKIFSMETEQLLGMIIQSVFWLIGILFLLDSQLTKTSWLFCNKEHPFRFQSVFVLCVLIGCLLPFFPEQTWFFVVISICLALLSNVTIGIVSSSFLLVIITQLANCKISTFFLYFLVSIIGIILFSKVEKDMKIGWPIFITVIYQIALQFVVQVFFLKQGIHFDFKIGRASCRERGYVLL